MPAQPLSLPQDDPPGAPFLFSPDIIQEITDQEKRGIYTAERCPADKKRAILTLLKEGRSFREVAQLVTSVKEETVKAVYDAHALDIDQARQMSAKILPKARYALNLQLDRLIASPGSVPYAAIGLLGKQLYDMTALEEGKPTERTEHRETKSAFIQFQHVVEQLKNKKAPAEVIGSENTGLPGGKIPLIHGQAADPGPVIEAELLEADTDRRSEDLTAAPQATDLNVTGIVTDPGQIAGQIQTPGASQEQHPGGGDGPAERPASTPTDNGSRNFSANGSEES